MTDEAATGTAAPPRSFWKEALGKNLFDDRLDTRPDVKTAEALTILGRSAKVLGQARGLFLGKFLLQLVMVLPGLYLPWMARIVVDHAALQEPFGETEVVFPPFMAPVLQIVENQTPMGVLLTMTLL